MTLTAFEEALDLIVARCAATHVIHAVGLLADGRIICDPCYVIEGDAWKRACALISDAKPGEFVRLDEFGCWVLRVGGDGLTVYDLPVDSGCLAVFDADSEVAVRIHARR